MAEDSPLPPSSQTQISPQHSPTIPTSNFHDNPLVLSEFGDQLSTEMLILDGDEVSGVFHEVYDDVNQVSGVFNEVSSDDNHVSAVCSQVCDQVFGASKELSGDNSDVCTVFHEVSSDFSESSWGFNEVSRNSNEIAGGFSEVSCDCNQVSGIQLIKKDDTLEGFDNNDQILGDLLKKDDEMLKDNSDAIFDKKVEVDEFLELKDETSSESVQCNGALNQVNSLQSISKKLATSSKNGDRVASYPLTMKLIDETFLIEFSDNVGKNSGIRVGIGGSNAVCAAASSNGTSRKMYSRKELEKLRFMDVRSQRKLWQQVYNGFDEYVTREYVELGLSFNYFHYGDCMTKKNYEGILPILGMAAGTGRCCYPSVYFYERNGTINC